MRRKESSVPGIPSLLLSTAEHHDGGSCFESKAGTLSLFAGTACILRRGSEATQRTR